MRILTIVLALFPFFAFSQINLTDSNGLRQGLWKKQQPNGKLIYEGHFKDGKPVGEWKRYHENGQIKAIITYSEASDSAYTTLYDVLGKKVAEGIYLNQKKEGNWSYFSNNRIIAEEEFKFGLKNGVSKKYYNSGELFEKSDWKNNMQDGNYQVFFKSGEPYMQCKMKLNMRNGLCQVYHDNKVLQLEAFYKNNLRHGDWKNYDEDGKLTHTLKYDEGVLLNPEVRDSLESLKMKNLEKGKGTIIDPEKFMQDPSEYMQKMKIYR